MNYSFYGKKLTATLIAMLVSTCSVGTVFAQGSTSSGRLNPYLADCYRNVTYKGKIGHHFSITLPHTNTCNVDRKLLPPGLSLKGCDIEGTPSAPGKWDFPVLLESKCHGIHFGKINIPITILID